MMEEFELGKVQKGLERSLSQDHKDSHSEAGAVEMTDDEIIYSYNKE